jgi:hypothetical protein
MIADEFRKELISELSNGGSIKLETLRKYKKLGMDQDSMYKVLEALMLEMREKGDEKSEDDVMDAADVVVGFCSPQLKLFPEQDLIELRNSYITGEDDIKDVSTMLPYIIAPLLSDDVTRQFERQLKCIRHMRDKKGQKERLLVLIDEAIRKVSAERKFRDEILSDA